MWFYNKMCGNKFFLNLLFCAIDKICQISWERCMHTNVYHQLRARRALLIFNVLSRTRRALLMYKVYGYIPLVVLNKTLNCINAVLVPSQRYVSYILFLNTNMHWRFCKRNTVETLYNKILGTEKFCLLYQSLNNQKQRRLMHWDQRNQFILFGILLYQISLYLVSTVDVAHPLTS